MHELALAQDLIDQVLELTRPHPGTVREIEMHIGQLTAVNAEALQMGFEALRTGTRLEDCELLCVDVPLKVRCASCEEEGPPIDPLFLACSRCQSGEVTIIAGRQMQIARVRVDDPEDDAASEPPDA